MRYAATFPLLLNIADQPTYFMALKGEDGLVKMYAMVNVESYQIVETGSSLAECESNYRKKLAGAGVIGAGQTGVGGGETTSEHGVVAEVRSAVIEGNTHFYVRLEHTPGYLDFNAAETPRAALLDVGDSIWYDYVLEGAEFPENGIIPGLSFKFDGEE